jgi:O-antigen ligase
MVPERQKVLLYLTVVLLTVPLDFHPIYLESNTTPWPVAGWRISLFDVTFLFLLVCWLLRRVLDNTWRIRLFPRLTLAYGLLWGLCLLSLARADLPLVIKLCALFLVTESWFIFLYFANQLLNPRLLWGVVAALLAAGAFQALLGLLQYFSGGTLGLEFFGEAKTHMMMRAGDVLVSRVSGTFGHPNNLAGYLAMVLQLNLALLFAPLKRGLRVLLGACLGLLGVALLLTLSRGGWLAGTLGVMITAFLCLRRRTRRPALAWFVTLLVSGVIIISTIVLVEPLKRRLFEEDYGAAQVRIPLAQVALNIIRHHPLLGVGLTNYVAAAPAYDQTKEAVSFTFPRPVHNEFLLIAAETGLPALGLFGFIFLSLAWGLIRTGKAPEETPLTYLALGLVAALGAWGAFRLTDYHYVLLADPFWVLAGLAQAVSGSAPPGPRG